MSPVRLEALPVDHTAVAERPIAEWIVEYPGDWRTIITVPGRRRALNVGNPIVRLVAVFILVAPVLALFPVVIHFFGR